MKVEFIKLDRNVPTPKYATVGSAGFDLVANNFKKYIVYKHSEISSELFIEENNNIIALFPNDRLLVGTGLIMSIPEGYELQIRSRSGNALKKGLVVLNSPGTIDSKI